MSESFNILRPMRFRQRLACRRGGMFVLELILLLPIILLVLVLLYQVSIMMTTYQALRVTVFNASEAFAQNPVDPDVEDTVESTIHSAIQGYYFRNAEVVPANSDSDWATTTSDEASVKYRLLCSPDSGTTWSYYSGTSLENGSLIAVELKLENAENAYKRYWLLNRFANVQAVQSGSMVLSQITAPKMTP